MDVFKIVNEYIPHAWFECVQSRYEPDQQNVVLYKLKEKNTGGNVVCRILKSKTRLEITTPNGQRILLVNTSFVSPEIIEDSIKAVLKGIIEQSSGEVVRLLNNLAKRWEDNDNIQTKDEYIHDLKNLIVKIKEEYPGV